MSIGTGALFSGNTAGLWGGAIYNAGDVELPKLSMRSGYFEYGFGFTKTIKQRLSAYAQMVFRSGGRQGVGFQFGLTWRI